MRFKHQRVNPAVVPVAKMLNSAGSVLGRARRATKAYAAVTRFASRGIDFAFDPDGTYSYETIHVGDHVNLGSRPTLLATRSRIVIGSHVLFGPGVTIRGGNHRFDIVGRYMDTVGDAEKRPNDDRGVVIEDDVWIGGEATILQGVTVGRGSVIAAAAVVTKSVPPYSIVAGNPARIIRARLTPDQIVEHERLLGAAAAAGVQSAQQPGPQVDSP